MNRSALTFGGAFLLLGVAYLLDDLGVWDVRLAVVLPVVVIVAGLLLVVDFSTGHRP